MKQLILWFTLWFVALGVVIKSDAQAATLVSLESTQDSFMEVGCGGAGCPSRTRRGGQSFQLTSASTVTGLEINLQRNTGTGQLTFRIETNSGSAPSGSLVDANATCTVEEADTSVGSYTWEACNFGASVTGLSTATTYWIVVKRTTETGSDINYLWGSDASSPSYASGNAAQYDNSVWAGLTGSDGLFKVIGTVNATPQTSVIWMD